MARHGCAKVAQCVMCSLVVKGRVAGQWLHVRHRPARAATGWPERSAMRADSHSERAAGQNRRKALYERNFSGVRGRQAKVPVRIAVVQRQRQQRPFGVNGRLQQRSIKAVQQCSIRCRAFRKNGNVRFVTKPGGNLAIDFPGRECGCCGAEKECRCAPITSR